jgi:uncharacterized protein (TIGR02118 family)
MIVFSVVYPATEGAHFDRTYYDGTHIPLVKKAFSPTGLRDIKILHGISGGAGGAAHYVAMAHLIFETAEALKATLTSPAAAGVFADVPNFTSITPVTQISTLE